MQISTDGGTQPLWAHSGREIFYRNRDKVMAVSIQTEPTLQAEAARLLFTFQESSSRGNTPLTYAIAPDDQRSCSSSRGGRLKSTSSSTGSKNSSALCRPRIEVIGGYLITSALIFAAVAILHLLRLINGWDFVLGSWSIPRWVSMGWHACLPGHFLWP